MPHHKDMQLTFDFINISSNSLVSKTGQKKRSAIAANIYRLSSTYNDPPTGGQ